ncbi:WXG100 family type VII secretion target [Lentzea sp. NPDC004782]|uniref:WXG100 family type VII secretion target n=1 Tax=Lentzea sp. NPDC004782 TaxID=3154458 RepID=UPI0033A40B66
MAGYTYTFNRGMADSVCDQMAAITSRLESELASMDRQIRATLGDWDDGAKHIYEQARSQWDAAAVRMHRSLNGAQATLNNITGSYLDVERAGMNAWGGYSVK